MKSIQAAALRVKWSQRVDPLPCEHLQQEMESNDGGYLAGRYHCIACGEFVAHS